MKISNKRELQQVALNHSSYMDFTDFTDYYENKLLNLKQKEMLINSYDEELFELKELAKKLILIT